MSRPQRKAEKSDARGGKFLLLPHCLINSEAYRTASPRALKALTAICLKHNGFNNGRIAMSCRDLATMMDNQNHGANSRALGECVLRGFLEIERDYPKGQRLAREYRLTFISTEYASATNDYLHWRPGDAGTRNKQYPRGRKRVVEFSTEKVISVVTASTMAKFPVEKTATLATTNRENPPLSKSASVEETTSHIVSQFLAPARSNQESFETAGGLNSAAPDPEELRERALELIVAIGRGGQRRLAEEANIPPGTLSKFIKHGVPLNNQARIRLTCAMPRTEAAAARG